MTKHKILNSKIKKLVLITSISCVMFALCLININATEDNNYNFTLHINNQTNWENTNVYWWFEDYETYGLVDSAGYPINSGFVDGTYWYMNALEDENNEDWYEINFSFYPSEVIGINFLSDENVEYRTSDIELYNYNVNELWVTILDEYNARGKFRLEISTEKPSKWNELDKEETNTEIVDESDTVYEDTTEEDTTKEDTTKEDTIEEDTIEEDTIEELDTREYYFTVHVKNNGGWENTNVYWWFENYETFGLVDSTGYPVNTGFVDSTYWYMNAVEDENNEGWYEIKYSFTQNDLIGIHFLSDESVDYFTEDVEVYNYNSDELWITILDEFNARGKIRTETTTEKPDGWINN
jgi:hypothetical protein